MSQVEETLNHLFRRESGKIVAYLTRFFGPDHIDQAENAVQEALLRAVQSWPLKGIPDNPSAWILQVAKNTAIDQLRKNKFIVEDKSNILDELEAESIEEYLSENEIKDDGLKLMFICCHPILSQEARIALTLKTVCGFGIDEIAKAFLAKPETIAQRIVRAKRKISDANLKYEVPPPEEIEGRLDSVLEVLYLLFNEGYLATKGDSLTRKDLCDESIYRLTELTMQPICQIPKVFALLSLMHFQISRFSARTDTNGDLLLLEEQDRNLWDKEHIGLGLKYLELSAQGDELTDYHLEAGIASCHATAPNFESTDWERILSYYDILLAKEHSPIVALNRAVAVSMARGFEIGLEELFKIKNLPPLKSYYLLPATFAEIYRRMGNLTDAKSYYEEALDLVGTEPEKRLLQKRINTCSAIKLVKP